MVQQRRTRTTSPSEASDSSDRAHEAVAPGGAAVQPAGGRRPGAMRYGNSAMQEHVRRNSDAAGDRGAAVAKGKATNEAGGPKDIQAPVAPPPDGSASPGGSPPPADAQPAAGPGGSGAQSLTAADLADPAPDLPEPSVEPPPLSLGQGDGAEALERIVPVGRQAFVAEVRVGLADLRGIFEGVEAAVLEAGTVSVEAIDAAMSTARAAGHAALEGAQVTLATSAEARSAELTTWGDGAAGVVDQTVEERREQAATLGDTHGEAARAAGEEAAGEVDSRIEAEAAAAEAIGARHGGGGGETAQAKAEAASELSSDTADAVRGGRGDASARMRESGAQAAADFEAQAQVAASSLGDAAPQLVEQITQLTGGATSAIASALDSAQAAYAQQGEGLDSSFDGAGSEARRQLGERTGELARSFAEGGEQALSALEEEAEQTVQTADEALADVAPQLAGVEPGQVEAELAGPVARSYDDAGEQVHASVEAIGADVEGQSGVATDELRSAGGEVAARAAAVPDELSSAIDADLADFDAGLGSQVSDIQAQGDSAVADLGTELDEQLSEFDTSFQDSQGDLEGELDGQSQVAVDKAHEPVSTLEGRIGQAESRIDARAEMGFWQRQWEDIKGLFSWENLLTLLAGLAIGVLAFLAILALPEELVGLALLAAIGAIGAVAGALIGLVGTLIHNAFAGKSGWDLFEGWWQNMLIGAAFGAVLILIPELVEGALAAMAVSAVAAGVLTVIVNLVTGQPWDKNLIANMALAAIFVGIGRMFRNLFGRGEEVPPEVEPEETSPDLNPEESGGPEVDDPQENPPDQPGTTSPPTTLDELRAQLSDKSQAGFDQQRELLSPDRWNQIENGFRNPDGTYDVERANRIFESKAVDDRTYQQRVAARDARALSKARTALDKIKNACDETDGTNRPNASLGKGTSEEALLEEIRTGKPYRSAEGHYQKVANYIQTLRDQISALQRNRPYIHDPDVLTEIDTAIQRAQQRIDAMQPALDSWNARATSHPDVWNPDGSSKVQPGWPSNRAPL